MKEAWATCPITENTFVRIASHPSYPNRPGEVATVLTILRQFCAADGHQFWTDGVRLQDLLSPDKIITHNHVIDVYLLGLAAYHNGKLATLDRRIPVSAVEHGKEAFELIGF